MSHLNKFSLTLTVVWLVLGLAACRSTPTSKAPEETPASPVKSTPTSKASASIYTEAPQLAERVAAGELPPVEERLPRNPLVVQPAERVGVYGGVWRMGIKPSNDAGLLIRTIGYENLVRWDPQWTRVVPNVAQSVEVNEDSTVYTFHLREGMRWSDGAPFTADDILFWYEDVFLNKELTPSKPSWLVAGGEPVQVEKIDAATVVFRFAAPYGLFLQYIAQPDVGDLLTDHPRHYLQQFLPAYNPAGIEALVKEAGVANWVELFQLKSADIADRYINPDLPTLHAWVMINNFEQGGTELVAERNPYYWKIDTAFNQLPYIDRVVYKIIPDPNELLQMALNGEIDMQDRHIAASENRAALEANMKKGGYHFFTTLSTLSNRAVISLNQTHPNPVLREIFQNRDFRIGLSYAINRREIIEQVYGDGTEPYQVAPRPTSPFYHEQLAKQYLEYDVNRANEYLDRAGYSARDAEGLRLGPDGRRIAFTVEVSSDAMGGSSWLAVMEHVQRYWREVGVEIQVEDVPRGVRDEHKNTNQFDATVWTGEGGLDVIFEPRNYFPYTTAAQWVYSEFAPAWAYWYLDPDHPLAELPPEAAQQQMALYNQVIATGDHDKRSALVNQILDIAAEQFYEIGTSLPGDGYGIVKNNFHNAPPVMPAAWSYPHPAPTNPEQYFIDPQE